MNKLWIVLKREYLTRVTKKSFILVTLLTPLGMALIMFIAGYFTSQSMKSNKSILVKDDSGVLKQDDFKSSYLDFSFADADIDQLKNSYIEDGYDILLHFNEAPKLEDRSVQVDYYAKDKLSLPTIESLEKRAERALKSYKVDQSQIDRDMLDNLEISVNLENGLKKAEGEDGAGGNADSKFSSVIATGLSYGMGFLMYMVIFIFGGMVMRSVMEEKINRIVEVIISSIKPFKLMLGKILGVGLVGLTQIGIWIILIPIILSVVGLYFGDSMAASQEQIQQANELMAQAGNGGNPFEEFTKEFYSLNWWLILPAFLVFFFGGYLMYSSMFAAIGSTISDDLGEAQQFMFPIVIPVIIALVMIPVVFNDPDGPIAVFGSMFPLLSPILMPARLPFDPPVWQVFLSIIILVASIIFMIWIAARIYRVGIFMYGKKVTFKEIGKWMFYKG